MDTCKIVVRIKCKIVCESGLCRVLTVIIINKGSLQKEKWSLLLLAYLNIPKQESGSYCTI